MWTAEVVRRKEGATWSWGRNFCQKCERGGGRNDLPALVTEKVKGWARPRRGRGEDIKPTVTLLRDRWVEWKEKSR